MWRWIEGEAGSGKTQRLLEVYRDWLAQGLDSRTILCVAASGSLRQQLAERILATTDQAAIPQTFTPLSFCEHEVNLYWPLIRTAESLLVRQPLLLRAENEQELAEQLLAEALPTIPNLRPEQVVRHIIDNLHLVAAAGLPLSELEPRLIQASADLIPLDDLQTVARLALRFREACLKQGLLTYSLVIDLYCRVLLPQPQYQQQLRQRWQAMICDDLDEFPAFWQLVCALFGDGLRPSRDYRELAVSFNPSGAVRLGYGADPVFWQHWGRDRCELESRMAPPLSQDFATLLALVQAPDVWDVLPPERVHSIQTTTRRELLEAVAEAVTTEVASGTDPETIAIIAPGLDPVATYTLTSLLQAQGIAVQSPAPTTPLWSVAWIRALLHAMALVYPGGGRVLNPGSIAEMLTVLLGIDPVRAGLLADTCYEPSLKTPRLLPSSSHPRRDRLGAQASRRYDEGVQWLREQNPQPPLAEFFWLAMQQFGLERPASDLAAYRSLSEAVQRYAAVAQRLGKDTELATNFYQLLAKGTVTTAAQTRDLTLGGVTLSSIYQYRSHHLRHRLHYWLDVGSHLWNTAYSSFGGFQIKNPYIFLAAWQPQPWSAEATQALLNDQLQRSLRDLLQRCQERLVLCHSDLALNGSEAQGPLLSLLDCVV